MRGHDALAAEYQVPYTNKLLRQFCEDLELYSHDVVLRVMDDLPDDQDADKVKEAIKERLAFVKDECEATIEHPEPEDEEHKVHIRDTTAVVAAHYACFSEAYLAYESITL